jgi:hypothetical protein
VVAHGDMTKEAAPTCPAAFCDAPLRGDMLVALDAFVARTALAPRAAAAGGSNR